MATPKREFSGQKFDKVCYLTQQNYEVHYIYICGPVEFLIDALPLLVKLTWDPGTGREETQDKDIKDFVFN